MSEALQTKCKTCFRGPRMILHAHWKKPFPKYRFGFLLPSETPFPNIHLTLVNKCDSQWLNEASLQSNCAVNPIIYYWMSQRWYIWLFCLNLRSNYCRFREYFNKLLLHLLICALPCKKTKPLRSFFGIWIHFVFKFIFCKNSYFHHDGNISRKIK